MKILKTILKYFFCPLLTLVLISSVTGAAYGATLRIKPDKLKKNGNIQADVRLPFVVGSITESVSYHYPLKFPKGTRLKGLEYQHGGGALANTIVSIMRVKADASPALHFIMQGESSENTGSGIKRIWVEADIFPGAIRRVKKGWTYFVFVECDDNPSYVGDIKVFYE